MKRTLMLRNWELADFEVDPVTGQARVVDASEAGVDLLAPYEELPSIFGWLIAGLFKMQRGYVNRVALEGK